MLTVTWLDSETGARLAPIVFQHTFSFSKVRGTWSKAVLKSQNAVRFWSPAYAWDATNYPGVYGRDWWVPLGKPAKGTYKGWVREQVVSEFPTWMDDNGNILADPVWSPASNVKYSRSFAVN